MRLNLSTLIKILAGALLLVFITILGAFFTIFFIPHTQGEVKVPDVIGKDFETAFDILSDHKLMVKKTPRFSPKVPNGYVFNQNPSPGRRVRTGRQVEIFISQGKAKVVVPDVKGFTVTAAKNALSHSGDPLGGGGLRLGYLDYVHSNEAKEGQVLAQSPLPMSEVIRGTPVNLLVSQGPWPKPFEMPKLVGMRPEDALERARALGLVINRIEESYDIKRPEEVVINQAPPGGYRVKKGNLVNLVISRGGSEELESEETRLEIVRFVVPEGFYYKQIQIVITDRHGEREIYNNRETPGHVLEIPVRVIGDARISIYVDGKLVEQGVL